MQKIKSQTRRAIAKLTRLLRKTPKTTDQVTGKMGSLQDVKVDFGFPNEPLWNNLIEKARTLTEPTINDTTLGTRITIAQLLYDVAHARAALLQYLPADALEQTRGGYQQIKASAPYIGLSTAPDYGFYVAVLAILSIGGAVIRAGMLFFVSFFFPPFSSLLFLHFLCLLVQQYLTLHVRRHPILLQPPYTQPRY